MSKISQKSPVRGQSRRSAIAAIAKFSLFIPSMMRMEWVTEGVPAPKFRLGDRVAFSFSSDGDEIITYQGTVQGSVYCPENLSLDNQPGKGWFYAIHWQVMPGDKVSELLHSIDTSYLEPEAELRGL